MMFDSGVPGYGISISFVVSFGVIAGLLLLWMLSYLVKLRRRGAVTGRESMLGSKGIAMESCTGAGRVWMEGAPWAAVSKIQIEKDQPVVVTEIDGLTLEVEPASDTGSAGVENKT
jgi:membrane-bound serine protease (ClpP class)